VATCGAESQGFDATHGLEGATRREGKEKKRELVDKISLVSSLLYSPTALFNPFQGFALLSKGGQSFVLERE
jgi:hypothetical protein